MHIVRFHPDGRPDLNFRAPAFQDGSLGLAARARSAAVQEVPGEGWKILVSGEVLHATATLESFVLRLDPDGSLDRSFGSAGRVFLGDGAGEWSVDVLLDARQRILLLRRTDPVAITRLLSDGTLDPSFGEGGSVHLSLGTQGRATPEKLFLATSGGVGVVGRTYDEEDRCPQMIDGRVLSCRHPMNLGGARVRSDVFIARFTETGGLDASFGERVGILSQARRGFLVTSFHPGAKAPPLDDEWLDRSYLGPDVKNPC